MWDHQPVVTALAEGGMPQGSVQMRQRYGRVLMRFDRFARTGVNAPGTMFPK
jgi:hypothetical protein